MFLTKQKFLEKLYIYVQMLIQDTIGFFKRRQILFAWGGVNSHMAIRVSELQIPAALGVGEILYKPANS